MITLTQFILTVISTAAIYTACEMIYKSYKRKKATSKNSDF